MSHTSTPALVRQLVMYTRANPNASDCAQGIGRWWLDPGQVVDMQALEEALELLVRRRVFAERLAMDGRRSYRRICSDLRLEQVLAEMAA